MLFKVPDHFFGHTINNITLSRCLCLFALLLTRLAVVQFERLQFAYQKATRDAAYARTVEMLLERERSKKASAQAAADAEENHAVPN